MVLFWRIYQFENNVLVLLKHSGLYQNPKNTELRIGQIAPDFTLANTEGKLISVNDFTGKKIFLAFTSIECSACKTIYPSIKTFSEMHQDWQVILISIGKPDENDYLKISQNLAFPVLTFDNSMQNSDQVPRTPYFYLIDSKLRIANKGNIENFDIINASLSKIK